LSSAQASLWGSEPAQLLAPSQWRCDSSWQQLVHAFWAQPDGVKLLKKLRQAQDDGATIFPPQPLRALELTALDHVQVVILGQDPYHQPGQANGLAFSVGPGHKRPPSLRNILTEVARSTGSSCIADGQLEAWAEQGVLLLNSVLTVTHHHAGSHAGWGWETLTRQILSAVGERKQPVAFVLWGAHAQALRQYIDETRHRVWTANHPSPLSARRAPAPFVGCGHFSSINTWLLTQGRSAIRW
jgi:uracil-DNA glycosylase